MSGELAGFIEGIQILQKYMKKTDYVLQGEHDEIFVYTDELGDGVEPSPEDTEKLEELGFHRADDIDEQTWRYYT